MFSPKHDWCPEEIDAVDLLLVGMGGEDTGTRVNLCIKKYLCGVLGIEADPGFYVNS